MPPSYILKEITKLTGASNWNVWKVDMKMYFMGEEVWKIVSGDEKKPALESNPDNTSGDPKKNRPISGV